MEFTKEALESMIAYAWPGNFRELHNLLKMCSLIAEHEVVDRRTLEAAGMGFRHVESDPSEAERKVESHMPSRVEPSGSESASRITSLADLERKEIEKAIDVFAGNTALAAKELGISRRTLQYRIRDYSVAKMG